MSKLEITLTQRQECDFELLSTGGFAPLSTYMTEQQYRSALETMSLPTGELFPIPLTLDIDCAVADQLSYGDELLLRHREGYVLGALTVHEQWAPNMEEESLLVYGTTSLEHPGVHYLKTHTAPRYVSGELRVATPPVHYDFPELRLTPRDVQSTVRARGWPGLIGFQTRNPIHRAHIEIIRRACDSLNLPALFHPAVGMTKPGDLDYHTRVQCYRAAAKVLDRPHVLALLPLAMRMAGPREAVWHACIRKNYGCTHFIVGRDHAGPGKDTQGKPFYHPYAAHELLTSLSSRLPITPVLAEECVYLPRTTRYVPLSEKPQDEPSLALSATELRSLLDSGQEIPEWFTPPEIASVLQRSSRPLTERGFTLFFTGLPSAGKTTIAQTVRALLMERDARPVTLLDGDDVRKMLSSELTFTPAHRALNIRRIAYVASLITRSRGIAICAAIAPDDTVRREARRMVEEAGTFLLVHIATPASVCESRDRKGLYLKARKGEIAAFTGVSAPYEPPTDADITIDTTAKSAHESALQILEELIQRRLLPA